MSRCPLPPGRRQATLVVALLALVLGAFVASVLALATRSGRADEDEAEEAVSAPSRVAVKNGVVTLTFDAGAQRNAGIATERARPAPAEQMTHAYGTILDAAQLTELGNQYLDAKARVEMAQARVAVSRAAFARATTLYKDRQNVSAAELQSAEGRFGVDQAALGAAQSHLATVAASAQQAWGPVLWQALLDDAPLVKRLIARRDYLVKATLSPEVTVPTPPNTATVSVAGKWTALQFVSPATATDPRVQGTSYFYLAPAESGLLPGMNVTVDLPMAEAPTGVIVPLSAVVWLDGKAWVYLRTGSETFVRRAIEADRAAPGGGYIVSGLPADAEIAIRGAQMLLSEEFRAQVADGDQD